MAAARAAELRDEELQNNIVGAVEDMEERLQAAIKDMAAGAKPLKIKRWSMTAKLQELHAQDVQLLETIGEGTFGMVWKGDYQQQLVAVKKLKAERMKRV